MMPNVEPADGVSPVQDEDAAGRRLCSLVSKASGEDPGGSGSSFTGYLILEVAPPWTADVAASGRFPEGLREALGRLPARVVGKLTALLPDPEYSREGHTRVLYISRPEGPFASYAKREWSVPDGEVVPLVEALARPEALSLFESYAEDTSHIRDLLVCTHGGRDVCCGKFGYPIYEMLRREHADPGKLRVWRSSHLGGHRFAPTLLDLPEGRYWGHLEPEHLENLVLRQGDASDLRRLCRGWAGLGGPFEQLVEREILAREGWEWTGYLREGRVLWADDEGKQTRVRIGYGSPDGENFGAYEATVEAAGAVMTLPSSGTDPLEEAPQYRVVGLEKVASP